MEDASHTYRKYKDIRDKCVFYNKDWERSVWMLSTFLYSSIFVFLIIYLYFCNLVHFQENIVQIGGTYESGTH